MAHDSHVTAVYARTLGLGVLAGLRSQFPLALLAWAASQDRFAVRAGRPLSLLRSPVIQRVLAASAVGEIVGDKLPVTPSRLSPGPLLGRLVLGGLAGAAMTHAAARSPLLGTTLGAAGALLGAESGYHARAFLDRATDVPDPVWGTVEDAAAIALGLLVLRSLSTTPEV